jgi:hypothetical protein
MTHPSDSRGLSHLFIEPLAEFALQRLAEVYLGNAKSHVASSTMRFASIVLGGEDKAMKLASFRSSTSPI